MAYGLHLSEKIPSQIKAAILVKPKYLFLLISSFTAISTNSFLLTGCSSTSSKPSWETRYDKIADPILKEYEEIAQNMSNDALTYSFSFSLEDMKNSASNTNTKNADGLTGKSFLLKANFNGGELATLTPEAIAELEKKIVPLKTMQNVKLHIVGHTDSRPISPQTRPIYPDNQALSEARARSVAEYLKKSLPNATITHEGRGEAHPVASNGDSIGQAQNRRVEVNVNAEENTPVATTGAVIKPQEDVTPMPTSYQPWWHPLVIKPFSAKSKPTYATTQDLFSRAIAHSNQIKVFSELPLIRYTAIDEAEGKFDTHAFVEAMYHDLDEPIGSTLKTGQSQGRFLEQEWYLKGGVRQPLKTGGEVQLYQKIGVLDNNSLYLNPTDQANARLFLSFRQPLLNGAGYEYNQSTVEVAKVDHSVSNDEFIRQVEAHLLEVHRAYWGVYLERAVLLQKKKLLSDTEKVLSELQARRGIDTLESDVTIARAAVEARRADSVRYEQAVRNAEGKLLALINDPDLKLTQQLEIVPVEPPTFGQQSVDMAKSVQLALKERPEIKQAFKQLKASVIRLQMADKEVLPLLDLTVEAYLAGLEGNRDYSQAVDNEFTDGGPSYAVTLLFDMPIDNQAAEARQRRRRLEVRQLVSQAKTTIDTVLLEVQVSAREVETAYRELNSTYHALLASSAKLDTLKARRGLNAGGDNYLQRMLDGQEQLALGEQNFLNAYVTYNISWMNLQRAQGVLLAANQIMPVESEEESLEGHTMPVIKLQREQKQDEQPAPVKARMAK